MLPEIKTAIPGSRSIDLAEDLKRHESRNITYFSDGFPVFWERAEGVNVWDADGNRFLDWTSAFGVAGLGHGACALRDAISEQAGRLWHAMGDVHPTAQKAALCRELAEITFGRWRDGDDAKVILANSGFESVEAALKTAFLASGKPGVIVFEGAYHGLGYGALTATGLPEFRRPFESQLAGWAHTVAYPYCFRCPFGQKPELCEQVCLERIGREIAEHVANHSIGAILVEPIQGRGGEVVPPPELLPFLRKTADDLGLLLILDEIYTGFWRTGSFFACEARGVVPDMICLGKALTGGFPLSACVGRRRCMDAWPLSQGEALHTSTYLGNPLGCAMALSSLTEWRRNGWGEKVFALSKILEDGLHGLQRRVVGAGDVRGRGGLWGIEIIGEDGSPDPFRCGKIIEKALARGILILGGGRHHNVLTFCPPLIISKEEVVWTCDVIEEIWSSV